MPVVGYVYGSSFHCPACAKKDQDDARLTWTGVSVWDALAARKADENGVYHPSVDTSGNKVRAVLATDVLLDDSMRCDNCRREVQNQDSLKAVL